MWLELPIVEGERSVPVHALVVDVREEALLDEFQPHMVKPSESGDQPRRLLLEIRDRRATRIPRLRFGNFFQTLVQIDQWCCTGLT